MQINIKIFIKFNKSMKIVNFKPKNIKEMKII